MHSNCLLRQEFHSEIKNHISKLQNNESDINTNINTTESLLLLQNALKNITNKQSIEYSRLKRSFISLKKEVEKTLPLTENYSEKEHSFSSIDKELVLTTISKFNYSVFDKETTKNSDMEITAYYQKFFANIMEAYIYRKLCNSIQKNIDKTDFENNQFFMPDYINDSKIITELHFLHWRIKQNLGINIFDFNCSHDTIQFFRRRINRFYGSRISEVDIKNKKNELDQLENTLKNLMKSYCELSSGNFKF